jgi:hypothetical protein
VTHSSSRATRLVQAIMQYCAELAINAEMRCLAPRSFGNSTASTPHALALIGDDRFPIRPQHGNNPSVMRTAHVTSDPKQVPTRDYKREGDFTTPCYCNLPPRLSSSSSSTFIHVLSDVSSTSFSAFFPSVRRVRLRIIQAQGSSVVSQFEIGFRPKADLTSRRSSSGKWRD